MVNTIHTIKNYKMKNQTKPSLKDKIIMWFFTRSKAIQNLIDIGISEAYDLGYERGLKKKTKKN